jgi:hypothetical protein
MADADDHQGLISQAGSSRDVPRMWRVLAFLACLIVAFHDFSFAGGRYIVGAAQGGLGGSNAIARAKGGFAPAVAISPDGPLASVGVKRGDGLRFDNWVNNERSWFLVGEAAGFSFRHDGVTRRGEAIAQAHPPTPILLDDVLLDIANLFVLAIGALIALRSRRRRAGFLLGAALICVALNGTTPSPLEAAAPGLLPVSIVLLSAVYYVGPILFLAFAREQRREARGARDSAVWRWAFWIGAAWLIVSAADNLLGYVTLQHVPVIGELLVQVVGVWLLYALALVVLLLGWRESEGVVRTRFGFLALAYALVVGGLQGIGLYIDLTGSDWRLSNPALVLDIGLAMAGALVLAYAILRHRIIDLGFAVNRTLVYGVFSALLLVLFGIAEWAVKKLIPREAMEANIAISAGIALAIFLFFHHVRDWIEEGVKHVFFRSWRENEAKLQRVVRNAAHITRPEALRSAAVAEFRRFSHGAQVALYRSEPAGYALEEGAIAGLPAAIDPDLPMLVRLRAEQTPLDADLPAGVALLLPLNHRNELTGFFALGAKPSQDAYRPDEIALLAGAAAKIGLDLQSLRVERLEAESREQRRRADILESALQRALTHGPPA